MNIKHQKASVLFMPHIVHREIKQKIVIRFTLLQKRLASGDILKESICISPNTIGGRHIYRSIELPTRPFSLFGRIGCSMKKNVIYTRKKQQIQIGFTLRKRGSEMLGQPSKCFGAGIRFSCNMCSRGSIFKHR